VFWFFLFLCVAATDSTNFPLGINKVYIYLSIYLNGASNLWKAEQVWFRPTTFRRQSCEIHKVPILLKVFNPASAVLTSRTKGRVGHGGREQVVSKD